MNAERLGERGFSLVEMMVTMVIAMVILGGLLLNFTQQHKEYKYQMKRVDTVQDMEFVMKFMAEDLRGILWNKTAGATTDPNPVENASFAGANATSSFTFWVWDDSFTTSNGMNTGTYLAKRKYVWDSASQALRYDRFIATMSSTGSISTASPIADSTTGAGSDMLPNVTFFKVFKDGVTSRTGFSDIPAALPAKSILDAEGNAVSVPGYTILIEMKVDAGYNEGSLVDVKGASVTDSKKRVWRYIQVYPMSVMG